MVFFFFGNIPLVTAPTGWRAGCLNARCSLVLRLQGRDPSFDENDINYCEYDMETNAIGARLYQEVNGRGVLILFIGQHRILGFFEGTVTKTLQDTGL